MHGKERSDGIFIFITKTPPPLPPQPFFSFYQHFSCSALLHDQRELRVVSACIQRLFLSEILLHFLNRKQNNLIALEFFLVYMFGFFFWTNAASYGLTQTRFTPAVVVWRKSFDANCLGTLHGCKVGDVGEHFFFLILAHKHADCVRDRPTGMQEPPLREETFRISWRSKQYTLYCTLKALPPVSQYSTLLQSCSEPAGIVSHV